MGLETAGFISELVATNPVGAVDDYATADDHLRLIKAVLQGQFPNFTASAVNPTNVEMNRLVGLTALTVDLNILAGANAGGLTAAELLFVADVTSAIQGQLDGKAPTAHTHGTAEIDNNAITLPKLLDIATASFLGRLTAATGDPEVLTGANARTIINVENGSTADQTAGEIEGIVNHDNLLGVSAAEHVDWAAAGGENIQEGRILLATETVVGGLEVATQAEADAGSLDTKIITPAKLSAVAAAVGVTKVKTADKGIASNTTEEDDNHLFGWVLNADSIYMMTGYISYSQDGGNFRCGFSTSQTHVQDFFGMFVTDAVAFGGHQNVDLTSGTVITGPGVAQRIGMSMKGFIKTHATLPPTVNFEWAQSTTDTDPTTVHLGSWITFTKVA